MGGRNMRVLIVDDDRDILDLLKYNLEKEGFSVKTLANSSKALGVAKKYFPDLIILDIMMPPPNGIVLCRELRSIRRFRDTHIFFLTAHSENYYQQAAFDTGGDDYIGKVIGLRALTHKVSAVLRNNFVIRKSIREFSIGGLRINQSLGSVFYQGHRISLSRHELDLLFFLAQNATKVITMENLVHIIWGSEMYLQESSVERCLENLQRKLGITIVEKLSHGRFRFIVN